MSRSSFFAVVLMTCAAALCLLSGAALGVGVLAAEGGEARRSSGLMQAPFTEEAQLRGIDFVTDSSNQFGAGAAFADLDNDGDPDLVVLGREDGTVGVYENDGSGFFTDHSATSGVPPVPLATGVIAGDHDRDGDLDLYISQGFDIQNTPDAVAPNVLLRNEGSFSFSNVTAEAGVEDQGPTYGCAWGDYDNDGWLDLYVSNRFVENRLYHNLGNGTFEEVAEALGVDRADDPTFQSSFFDYDHDGDADLYVANDKANCSLYSNHFFENVGGTFVEITEASGTEACVWSMCIAIGDFNGNQHQDMYITNLPTGNGNALLINNGDGTFSHQETQAAVNSFAVGWGSVLFDYDNDGHLDLYVCNDYAANRLYRHEGQWPCADVSSDLGVDDTGRSFIVAAADIDDDGDLDLIMQNLNEALQLFINHEGQTRRWVKFDVVGQGPQRFAVGANVEVRTGQDWQLREVIAGCNFMSQNELTLHFGLGGAPAVDEVLIRWPAGTMRTIHNLATNLTWTLYPADKLGDGDQDGDYDLEDFLILASCFDSAIQPGCEMMDFDGLGWIDLDDFGEFMVLFEGEPEDCDGSGTIDMEEILIDPGLDQNANGILDSCECPGDLDGDVMVGITDLLALLAAWGTDPGGPPDFDGDGDVGITDLLELLAGWGPCE